MESTFSVSYILVFKTEINFTNLKPWMNHNFAFKMKQQTTHWNENELIDMNEGRNGSILEFNYTKKFKTV